MMGEAQDRGDFVPIIKYTSVNGFFQQDDLDTIDKGFDYVSRSNAYIHNLNLLS